jgi:DNA-binding transcriptional LysR family regulator
MSDLDVMFAGDDFEPASASETYRLTGTDYAALFLGPVLFRQVFKESPKSHIIFTAWHESVFDDLERGTVDLVFFGVAPPARMRSQELFEEHFNCVMSASNPLAARDGLDLETYLSCSHVGIEVNGGDQTVIDRHLLTLGTRRQVSLQLPYHTAAAAAIGGTNLVATLPARLTAALMEDPNLRVVRAPIELDSMTYQMSWHPRLDGDPAHRWLRRTITEVIQKDF